MKDAPYSTILHVRIPQYLVDRVDYIADKSGLNRSDVARNLILMGLEDAELLDKVGALRGYRFFRDVIRQLGQEEQKGEI